MAVTIEELDKLCQTFYEGRGEPVRVFKPPEMNPKYSHLGHVH